MMKICMIMATPRKNGSTATLAKHFAAELEASGAQVEFFDLCKQKIEPCVGCDYCQSAGAEYACSRNDPMGEILDAVFASDCFVYVTPIYSWFCTPELKAFMDRLYGTFRFAPGSAVPSLWSGQRLALITTCGGSTERNTDLLDESVRRGAGGMEYVGMLALQSGFSPEEGERKAREFAQKVLSSCRERKA